MTRTYYNADITVRFRVTVASASLEEAENAAKRAASFRPGVRVEHISDVRVSLLPSAEDVGVYARHMRQECEAIMTGTGYQRERWNSGCLPEAELLEIARNELFKPFGLLTQRRKMVFAAINHPKADNGFWKCVQKANPHDTPAILDDLVEWSTTPHPDLSDVEWLTLGHVNQAVAEVIRHPWMSRARQHTVEVGVQVREHRGVCKRCQESTKERSALVSIQWAGRVLSREYVL